MKIYDISFNQSSCSNVSIPKTTTSNETSIAQTVSTTPSTMITNIGLTFPGRVGPLKPITANEENSLYGFNTVGISEIDPCFGYAPTTTLKICGDTQICKDLTVWQDLTVYKDLTVFGHAQFTDISFNILEHLFVEDISVNNLEVLQHLQFNDASGKNLVLNGNLTAKGHSLLRDISGRYLTLAEDLDVIGNTTIGGNATITGDVDISGNMEVENKGLFGGLVTTDLDVSGYLDISGHTYFVDASGENLSLSGNLDILGKTTFIDMSGSNLTIDDNMWVGNTFSTVDLNVTGNVNATDISGWILEASYMVKAPLVTCVSLFAYGVPYIKVIDDIVMKGDVDISGGWLNFIDASGIDLDISRNLNISGHTSFIDASGRDLDLSGNLDVSGNLNVAGTATIGSLAFSSLDLTGYLDVSGHTSFVDASGENLDLSGNLDVSGNLNVAGTATIGSLSFSSLELTGYLDVSGHTSFVDASGEDLDLSGNLDVAGNLNVTGTATIGSLSFSSLDLTGYLDISGHTYFVDASGEDLDLSGNLDVTMHTQVADLSATNVDVSGVLKIGHGHLDMSCNGIIDISGLIFCNGSHINDASDSLDISANSMRIYIDYTDDIQIGPAGSDDTLQIECIAGGGTYLTTLGTRPLKVEGVHCRSNTIQGLGLLRVAASTSAVTPTITWEGDQDTGFYRNTYDSSSNIAISCSGEQIASFSMYSDISGSIKLGTHSSIIQTTTIGPLVFQSETITAAGALSPLTPITFLGANASTPAYTLDDASHVGQQKQIITIGANDGSLTPTTTNGTWISADFTDSGECLTLVWSTSGWSIVSRSGGITALVTEVSGAPKIA